MELYPVSMRSDLVARVNSALAVARRSVFWKQRLAYLPERIASLEEFAEWPVTKAEEVADVPVEDRVSVEMVRIERVLASSGGPQTAKYFGYTLEDVQCHALGEDFVELGVPSSGFVLNLTPESWGGGTLLIQMARRAGMSIVSPPLQMLGAFLPVLLRRMRFRAVLSLPSKVPGLVSSLEAAGVNPAKLGIELVMIGGEVVSPWLVEYIGAKFKAKVINLYGSVDTGGLGNGLGAEVLLYGANYCESVNGELVVTNLAAQGSPAVRYALGDEIDVLEPGHRPKIVVRGRKVDGFETREGKIWARDIEDRLFRELGRPTAYSIVVGRDAVEVEAVADATTLSRVEAALAPLFPMAFRTRPVAPDEIEPSPGKLRRVKRCE